MQRYCAWTQPDVPRLMDVHRFSYAQARHQLGMLSGLSLEGHPPVPAASCEAEHRAGWTSGRRSTLRRQVDVLSACTAALCEAGWQSALGQSGK